MRLLIKFTPNTAPVDVKNQHCVVGYFHKLLGSVNIYHNTFSNYSLSMLNGGVMTPDFKQFNFPNLLFTFRVNEN